jgi:U32 family peptidase
MKLIELLSPAGSIESLYAAVLNGADAVYIGGSKFSARAYANNFDEESLKAAVNYCHQYGVKLYVTLNTLIKESELEGALNYASFLYSINVDAVIIQDTGLIFLIKKYIPELELHASTQMTVNNGEGALYLKEKGLERIVLSRELSLAEIKHISKDLEIETEIFIHGALCICYSGQCLMSSLIGGRSGNRGRCAQPCRLPYELYDENGNKSFSGYILSPKDMCTIDNIEEIIDSGTSSLKIEGRMKKAQYTAGVTSSYRKAIDLINSKTSKNETVKLKHTLSQLFNREGFSKGYLFGNTGHDMMSYNFPKNTGIRLGKVKKDMSIYLEEEVSVKDGIRCSNSGFTVSKIIMDGSIYENANKGSIVKLEPQRYQEGDVLYKTSDDDLNARLEETYRNPYSRKIGITAVVSFLPGENLQLKASFLNKEYYAVGEIVQKALKKPLEKERIIENLCKSGDTPYKIIEVIFDAYEDGFISISALNSLRRELIEKISSSILNNNISKQLNSFKYKEFKNVQKNKAYNKDLLVCLSTRETLKACLEMGINNIAVDLFMRNSNIKIEDLKGLNGINIYLKIPNIIKGEFKQIQKLIYDNLGFITGIVTANLGIINVFKGKCEIIGSYKLNVMNSMSSNFFSTSLNKVCLSVELSKSELQEAANASTLPVMVLIYGKIENMVSEHCPIGSAFGDRNSKSNCSCDCTKGSYFLKDRIGKSFKVLTDIYCRSHIYNSSILNLIGNLHELDALNIDSYRLDFIDESYEEALNVLSSLKDRKLNDDFSNYTRGHFKRGVE